MTGRRVATLRKVSLIYDDVFLKHETGAHPENKQRLTYTYNYVTSKPLFDNLIHTRPRRASDQEILLVHTKPYYDYLRRLGTESPVALDPDTIFGSGSLDAALHAAGAVTLAVEGVRDGVCDSAFCLVRPPGHHALPQKAMGFCIFNNVAVGAAYATRICGFERAAIVDFDVHHGNGTQEIFYEDGKVLYCSIHEWPFYPGTGSNEERGRGSGQSKTVNVPLPAGAGQERYMEAMCDSILPALEDHRPSIIFVSAGFDAHEADPIGGMCLTSDSFRELTLAVKRVASAICDGKIVSVLEGGYNVKALAASVHAHIEGLLHQKE